MDTKIIHETMEQDAAGSATFPESVARLMAAGVESYFTDLLAGRKTFYGVGGGAIDEGMAWAAGSVAEEFSQSGVIAAIRAAQQDEVRYPEFVPLARGAGVAGYWAFLSGQKVIYFGRQGETHVEHFPGSR